MTRRAILLFLSAQDLCPEEKTKSLEFGTVPCQEICAGCKRLRRKWITLINDVSCVPFFLQFFIRKNEMFEIVAFFASHVLHQVLRNKAKILFDLFDESIAIFEV